MRVTQHNKQMVRESRLNQHSNDHQRANGQQLRAEPPYSSNVWGGWRTVGGRYGKNVAASSTLNCPEDPISINWPNATSSPPIRRGWRGSESGGAGRYVGKLVSAWAAAEVLEKQDTCSVAKASMIGAEEETSPATEAVEEESNFVCSLPTTTLLFRLTLERTHSSCINKNREFSFDCVYILLI